MECVGTYVPQYKGCRTIVTESICGRARIREAIERSATT
jgi:hypothetical protein